MSNIKMAFFNIMDNINETDEVIDIEDYVYVEPVNHNRYVSIYSTNKALRDILHSTITNTRKTLKCDERLNTLNYFNSIYRNIIKLSAFETFDVKDLLAGRLIEVDMKKGNIMNTIFLILINYVEHGIGFSLTIIKECIPIMSKFTVHSFTKKYIELYECLNRCNPKRFEPQYKYYNELPSQIYYRGIRVLFRNFVKLYIGETCGPEIVSMDHNFTTYRLPPVTEFQVMFSKLERMAVLMSVWIILEMNEHITSSRIEDYYKIYIYILMTNINHSVIPVDLSSIHPDLQDIIQKTRPIGLTLHMVQCSIKIAQFVQYLIRLLYKTKPEGVSKEVIHNNGFNTIDAFTKRVGVLYNYNDQFDDIELHICRVARSI